MFQLPDGEDAERVADWVELEVCVTQARVSKAKVSSIIEGTTGSEPGDSFLSDIWRHLRYRVDRYVAPLLDIRHSTADLAAGGDSNRLLVFETCLYFSLFGASNQHGANPKLFERLAAEAIREYVGGESFVFGWPALDNVLTNIELRVRQVAVETRERFVEAPPLRYKDRGVDIITWKPFQEPDTTSRRACQYVLLSQCAAGRDWRSKTGELPLHAWTQYIHWAADPGLSFAVPCVITEDEWHDVAREVKGIVFDRIRLVNLLLGGVSDPGLGTELQIWTAEQRDEWAV